MHCKSNPHSLDSMMKMQPCRRNFKVEGMTLCRGSSASLQRHLLDYLCTGHFLDNHPLHFYPCPPFGWHMQSIGFILAYTQVQVKTNIYMKLPTGTTLPHLDPMKHLLKLEKNLYGLKDGQEIWYEHIKAGLREHGSVQSSMLLLDV